MISTLRTLIVSLGAILGIALSVSVVSAWTGPTASAPNSNIAAPVNVGTTAQIKSGDLTVNSQTAYGDLRLNYGWNPSPSTITYLNFSNAQYPSAPTWGTNGYGIRDNNGTLEFKNSGGTWQSLQTLITGTAGFWTGSGNNIYNSNTGNVGIGHGSPTHKLDVLGAARFTVTGGDSFLAIGDGQTSSQFSYIDLIGDTTYTDYGLRLLRGNTGANTWSQLHHRGTGPLYLTTVEAAPIVFNTSNLERMRVESNGNVGIGTITPGYKLDVGGTANTDYLRVDPQDGTNEGGELQLAGAGSYGNIQIDNYQGHLRLHTFASGKLFSLVGGGGIQFPDGTIQSTAAVGGSSQWTTSGTNIYNANAGNVGIGATNPAAKLDVVGNINATGNLNTGGRGQTDWYNINTGTIGAWGAIYGYGAICSGNASGACTGAAGTVLGIANTSATNNIPNTGDIFFNGGSVGIGTTNPGTSKLNVLASVSGNYAAQFTNTGTHGVMGQGTTYGVVGYSSAGGGEGVLGQTTSGGGHGVLGIAGPTSGASYMGVWGQSGSYYGGLGRSDGYSFVGSGSLYNAGTVYGNAFLYLSDRRFKENIRPLDEGLLVLMKLRSVSFTWKDISGTQSGMDQYRDGESDIGFIAQEVEKVFPELVHTDTKGYKSVDYVKVVPILVKSVQEQQHKIDSLEARISALEAKLR